MSQPVPSVHELFELADDPSDASDLAAPNVEDVLEPDVTVASPDALEGDYQWITTRAKAKPRRPVRLKRRLEAGHE